MIKNVGIIGSGTMGSGIAQVAAAAGCLVTLFDVHQQALDTAKQSLEKITNRLVEKGRISSQEKDAIQNNIRYVNSLKELAHSDLTIEAIVENIEVKKKVFQELEKMFQLLRIRNFKHFRFLNFYFKIYKKNCEFKQALISI